MAASRASGVSSKPATSETVTARIEGYTVLTRPAE